jgi:chromosome partitioning protein
MRTVAIVNQKGGCGKTTTTVNLAGCLAEQGARVLVVDVDPQAHATLALGVDAERVDENLYDVLAEEDGAERFERILVRADENVEVAPSGIVLSALEQKLASEPIESRTNRLSAALEGLGDAFDYVLIDCPPNVGLLTFNALRAASEVIVPLETSFFAIHGVQKLLETIALLTERIGHDLSVRILPTLYDGRTRYARDGNVGSKESQLRRFESKSGRPEDAIRLNRHGHIACVRFVDCPEQERVVFLNGSTSFPPRRGHIHKIGVRREALTKGDHVTSVPRIWKAANGRSNHRFAGRLLRQSGAPL